ncbi:MAG: NYN domain-containing protein [Chlorobiaceae bacterium]|nr:NYN domain-containing protein [Chlorobiaceae bacterium]
MEHSKETIAMLIDADNSPSDKIDFILAEMAKYGVVNIRRAYGNWKSSSLKGWEDKLHDYAIRPIQQFDYTKGKNATDMAMTIDGMDLLYGSKLDAFCIVSSDSDFTPLVMRILSEGLNVYGFGQKSTPSPFVNACSTFLYLESFGGQAQERSRSEGGRRKSPQELKSDSKLLSLVRNAVDSAQEEDGWSNLAKIGKNISNQASFDPRNYGFKRLSDLIRAIDLFESEFRNNNSELYIRDRRKRRPENGGAEGELSPVPSEPVVAEPVFTKPVRTEPHYTRHTRSEPAYTKPATPEPAASVPESQEFLVTRPAVTEPVFTKPVRSEPPFTRHTRSEPAYTRPATPEPAVAKPESQEFLVTKPASSEPVVAKPEPQEFLVTKPAVTEPEITKPEAREFLVTKPAKPSRPKPSVKRAAPSKSPAARPAKSEPAPSKPETSESAPAPEPQARPKRNPRRPARRKPEVENPSTPSGTGTSEPVLTPGE